MGKEQLTDLKAKLYGANCMHFSFGDSNTYTFRMG